MAIQFLATPIADAAAGHVAAAPQPTPSSSSPHLVRSPGEASHATRLWTARRVLPDPAICQASAAGFGGYANCLVERPSECPHALGFGYGFFCRHPQRHEIVMRTSTHGRCVVA